MTPENNDAQRRNVDQLISLITTKGILEAVFAESEEVRAVVRQVMEGYRPELEGDPNVPAEESPVGGYALGKPA